MLKFLQTAASDNGTKFERVIILDALNLPLCADDLRPPVLPSHPSGVLPQRARGAVDVAVSLREGSTRLARLRQSGCLKCILPHVFRPDAEAVLVNTSGGVTGGDEIGVTATLGAGTQMSITTQAAERIYRTLDGTTGRVRTQIKVGTGAHLGWLPQETILFDRARLSRNLDITLGPDASLLLCEMLVFGRAAMGEQVRSLHLEDRISITRVGAPLSGISHPEVPLAEAVRAEGSRVEASPVEVQAGDGSSSNAPLVGMPLYRDGIRLIGDAHTMMARPAIGGGAGALATLVLVAPQAAALLSQVRALLPPSAGASLRSPGVMVLRALARDSLDLRRITIPVLELLSGHSLPAVWRL